MLGYVVYNGRGQDSSLTVNFDAKAVRLSLAKPVALIITARKVQALGTSVAISSTIFVIGTRPSSIAVVETISSETAGDTPRLRPDCALRTNLSDPRQSWLLLGPRTFLPAIPLRRCQTRTYLRHLLDLDLQQHFG